MHRGADSGQQRAARGVCAVHAHRSRGDEGRHGVAPTPNPGELVASRLPRASLHRLLVETDAPYLAPQPYRGKRNEPAYVVHTAEKLADLRGVGGGEIAKLTSDNFFRLFSKVPKPRDFVEADAA